MALLRVLLELREAFGYPLTACHVNHGLRGETADRDEAFVRAECARLGVPLTVFRPADVGMAVPPHAGEDWARRLRYACFAQLLAGGIDCIATAHTATDQAETLLFRLARGTGLHGAGGIRPRRPGYCRPLLGLTRAETEALCAAFGQGWVTDETNESDAYARNRLRHGAVPALRSVNAAAEENLARFCEKAARADAYFARQAEQLLSIARLDAAQTARKAPKAKAAWRLEPLQALTHSFWKRRSTALLPRCGMPRKSTSACWQSWWSRGAGRCNCTIRSASAQAAGCSGRKRAGRKRLRPLRFRCRLPLPMGQNLLCPGAKP